MYLKKHFGLESTLNKSFIKVNHSNFENVGYARPAQRDVAGRIMAPARYGIYNILIMEEKQTILALGAGAITKRVWDRGENGIRIERCENARELDVYMNHIAERIDRKRRLFAED